MLSCMEPRVGDTWRKLELDETLLNESLSKTLTTLVLVSTNSRGGGGVRLIFDAFNDVDT